MEGAVEAAAEEERGVITAWERAWVANVPYCYSLFAWSRDLDVRRIFR